MEANSGRSLLARSLELRNALSPVLGVHWALTIDTGPISSAGVTVLSRVAISNGDLCD